MPTNTIIFKVNDRDARAGFNRLKREVDQLDDEFKDTRSEAERAGQAIDQLGDEARQSARDVDGLGDAARRNNSVWRDTNGRLRDIRGRFVGAGRGADIFAGSLGTVTNYALELEKLKATAEDTRRVLAASETNQQVLPNFQAALAASNAYYSARIRQAEAALAKEKEGTDAFNTQQVQIFQLGRQQLAAQRQLETERTSILRASTQERVRIEQQTNNEVITGLLAVVNANREALREQVEFHRQIAAIPRVSSPDTQFTAPLRQDFQETERQGRSLLDVMRQIAILTANRFDLDIRIPEPVNREIEIDERIAAETRGQQTLTDIRQDAAEQGRQFLSRIRQSEDRDLQRSLREQTRHYRQFANIVSNTFINLATGRARNFESVATAFIQQSIRIVLRAVVEHQLQKRLDDTLTASKIANIQKVAAAQQASGLSGVGGIPGLGNIGNIGNFLSGGGLALGASALLFPEAINNLTGGIRDEISGFLDNVAEVPDRAFGAQQPIFLRIGEGEIRDITDIQDELREESRV